MNAALIVLDAVRKDYFDEFAPRLRAMADVECHRCYTPSTWTASAHASMATGDLPHQHRVDAYSGDMSHLVGETFLDDVDATSVCVSSNINLNIRGFAEFFDRSEDPLFQGIATVDSDLHITDFLKKYDGDHPYAAFLAESLRRRTLTRSLVNGVIEKWYNLTGSMPPIRRRVDYGTKRTLAVAEELTPEDDFFLFVNLMEAHAPHRPVTAYDQELLADVPASWTSRSVDFDAFNRDYTAYPTYRDRFRDVYSATIDYMDRTLLDTVRDLIDRDTMVIVTADHGENLGYPVEGAIAHKVAKDSDGLAHVPFLVFNPPSELEPGLMTLQDVGDLILGGLNDDLPDVRRKQVGFERLGTGEAEAVEERWRGPKRGLYTDDRRWVWGLDSAREQALPIDLEDEDYGEPAERPANDVFECSIEEYLRRAEQEEDRTLDTEAVKHRLETLGYVT